MADDWSLKKDCVEYGIYEYDVKKVYKTEDVETLRKKLIKAVKEYCAEHYWKYDNIALKVIEIINARFGVEKEA